MERFGQDTEAGARLAFPIGGGIDLSLFYLMHWNRVPVFEADLTPTGPRLRVVQDRVHTVGFGFNKAFLESIVIRGDGLLTVNDPHQGTAIGPAPISLHAQAVIGGDYSTEDHFVLGAQYQYDATSDWQLHWVAAHVAKDFFDGKLQPELFVFRGINNSDMWIQPMLTWRFLGSASISARGDFLWASHDVGQGVLIPFDGVSRVFVWTRVEL